MEHHVFKKAEDDNFALIIYQDVHAENPREEFDNLGTMVCWHPRYNLGDKHDYSSPDEFYSYLVKEVYSNEELLEKANKVVELKKTEDGSWGVFINEEIVWEGDDFNIAFDEFEFAKMNWVFDPDPETAEKMLIESDRVVMLPLYLYDHGGITMSTTNFSCPWDSGQVGWIYARCDEAKAKFGYDDIDIEKIKKHLKDEVKTYDQYLRGDCYGFVLERKIRCEHCGETEREVLDSVWGFYGSDPEKNGMKDYLPEKYHHLFEKLDYVDQ